jgi:siroheme synthase-like protein
MTELVGIQSAAGPPAPARDVGASYPVVLDLHHKAVLVVGGGRVAARKVAGLVAAGARVTVVAPEIVGELEALVARGTITHRRRRYAAGEVARHRLVVTATGVPEVDAGVAADADAHRVWVNAADDPANCSFILPAIHRDGPVSISVSSSGTSPALASWLRDRIAACTRDLLGDATGEVAGMLAEARARVKASGRSTESIDWRSLLDGPFPTLVRDGRLDEARRLLDEAIG